MKSSNRPLISVIMNCHNGDRYLKKSIQSVISQNYKNWELIFWDNNSTDKSEIIFKSFKDKRLKYFKSKKYLKLYKARNKAIEKSKGKYITFIDTDDWWLKKKLEKLHTAFRKNKSYKIIYSNWYVFNDLTKTKKIFNNMKLPTGKITQKLLHKYEINVGTIMISKDIFKKFKFNEKFEIIGDFDLFIKLSLKYRFLSIQSPLSYYRLHKKNFSNNFKLHARELNNWINKNKIIFKKRGLDISKQVIYLYKLKLKSIINL